MLRFPVQYFCACLLLCTIISLSTAADTRFAASHFPIDENSSPYILITDAAGVAPTVMVEFYDSAGKRQNSIRKILRSHGSIEINVRDYLNDSGLIILSSDSGGIVSRYWRIYQNGEISPRRAETKLLAQSLKRSVSSYPLQLLKKRRQFCIPYDFTASSSSYIITSDVSSDNESSGSIIELYLYSQDGELLTALRKEIRQRETVSFKMNEYLDGDKIDVIAREAKVEILANKGNDATLVGESDVNQDQARTVILPPLLSPPSMHLIEGRRTGKAVLKIIEGNIICAYAQFPSETAARRKSAGFIGVLSVVPVDCVLTDMMKKPADNLFYFNFLDSRTESEKELIITDAHGYGPAVQIDFLNNPGIVLTKIRKLLPPHGTIALNLLDYVKLSADSGGNILSTGIIKVQSHIPIIANYKNPPILLTSISDTAENLAISWYSPSDNLQIYLLATNTGSESVEAQAILYDEDGTIVESKELHLKPKIVSAWQIETHFKQGQLGSIELHRKATNLSFLGVGVDANTKQVLMAIQPQEISKSDNF